MRRSSPLVLLAFACASEGRPEQTPFTTGIDVDDTSSAGSAAGDDGPRLDLGGSEMREGCNYVDLLFVIDNSGSMCDAQVGLAAVLPELVDAIFDALPADTDIHVGLTTTTFGTGGSHQLTMCHAAEGPATIEAQYVVDELVPGNGFQGRLYEWDGRPYFAGNTSSDAIDPRSRRGSLRRPSRSAARAGRSNSPRRPPRTRWTRATTRPMRASCGMRAACSGSSC
jgi:hypothetical protein